MTRPLPASTFLRKILKKCLESKMIQTKTMILVNI